MLARQAERGAIGAPQERRLTRTTAGLGGPHGVNDESRLQVEAGRDPRVAGGAGGHRGARHGELPTRRPVNGTTGTAARREPLIRRIHDRIDVKGRDVHQFGVEPWPPAHHLTPRRPLCKRRNATEVDKNTGILAKMARNLVEIAKKAENSANFRRIYRFPAPASLIHPQSATRTASAIRFRSVRSCDSGTATNNPPLGTITNWIPPRPS